MDCGKLCENGNGLSLFKELLIRIKMQKEQFVTFFFFTPGEFIAVTKQAVDFVELHNSMRQRIHLCNNGEMFRLEKRRLRGDLSRSINI